MATHRCTHPQAHRPRAVELRERSGGRVRDEVEAVAAAACILTASSIE